MIEMNEFQPASYESFHHKLFTNQICVEVRKEEGDCWFKLNKNAMFLAMKNLSKSGFELYMYIASNQEDYKFGLGFQPVYNATGMSAKSYQRATQELKEKGYLVFSGGFVKNDENITAPKWLFYSIPVL